MSLKMPLKEFRKIKERLKEKNYPEIQDRLLSCDLSNIPYEELDEIGILSNLFTKEFKEKYYYSRLTMDDLSTLSHEQIEEIKEKKIDLRMKSGKYNPIMITSIDLEELIKLYDNKELYNTLDKLLNKDFLLILKTDDSFSKLIGKLKNAKANEIKGIVFKFVKDDLINSRTKKIDIKKYPELFINENKELFLIDVDIPKGVKDRYYNKMLTLEDLLNYIEVFDKIPIDNFIRDFFYLSDITYVYGIGQFQKLVKKHLDLFTYLVKNKEVFSFFLYFKKEKSIPMEDNFISAVKIFLERKGLISELNNNIYLQDHLKSMNFKFIEGLKSNDDLMNLTQETIILNEPYQQTVIDIFGINNIKRLEKETRFFTNYGPELPMLNMIGKTFKQFDIYESLQEAHIDFKYGTLPYDKFLDEFSKFLNFMRKSGNFDHNINYDFIDGEFRNKYENIFIDKDAPEELKERFYQNSITPNFLYENQTFLKYLTDKKITDILQLSIKATLISHDDQEMDIRENINFIDEYSKRFGVNKLRDLILKYGDILDNIRIELDKDSINDEDMIEKVIRDAIYIKITSLKVQYSYLKRASKFVEEHPELFIDLSDLKDIPDGDKLRLEKNFYEGRLKFDDIKRYPVLADILKNKNLKICFRHLFNKYFVPFHRTASFISFNDIYLYFKIYDLYGPSEFLEIASKYGQYFDIIINVLLDKVFLLNYHFIDMNTKKVLEFDEFCKIIENTIVEEIFSGRAYYTSDNAPEFLKQQYPELFLSEDAPKKLKDFFYNTVVDMTFYSLSENYKAWKPYLENKAIKTSLLSGITDFYRVEMKQYFEVFGKNAIKLGIKKPETVVEMIKNDLVLVMKKWYDKTGGKFIPDVVVMQNFSLEEADKFLSSASYWNVLMKIKEFSKDYDARDAILKLAYSFGVFDKDQRGLKELVKILKYPPKKIDGIYENVIISIIRDIEYMGQRAYFKTQYEGDELFDSIISFLKNNKLKLAHNEDLINLYKAMKEENISIDLSGSLFEQFYEPVNGEEKYYKFTLDIQKYPKTCSAIKTILDNMSEDRLPLITPAKAHQLFGGFKLEYNPEFREFLLNNLDEILNNSDYSTYISSIQKQFKDIKRANINRKLTLALAISYVKKNKYDDIEVGNDRVAEVSAIAGYTQEDFDTLQKIYNYGKQRTFSSIPRIEGNTEKYDYEMLRLDDPLAMAVGTLSDCCQEIGNVAEVCMEHSMIDKNGRVFLIKDKDGNIVAQSWVWRNKDVICFDNIEIPDKAFKRAENSNSNLSRKDFVNEIYSIYAKAAHELIKKDEKEYKKLRDEGKITEEQYEGLKLKKVTVGLGYNDIAQAIKKQAKYDSDISKPLPFKPSVLLGRHLYTSDSTTQYILDEEEKNNTYNSDTLSIYGDPYIEYDDSNFDERKLLSLSKLEVQTKGDSDNLDILMSDENEKNIVREIADNYDLNPDATKIVMNSNFGIIYEENDNKVTIGDILYNTKIQNEEQKIDIQPVVILQIRLALEQIGKDKEIDISNLDDISKEIYNKAMKLTEDNIDEEKGIKINR